MNIFDYLRKKQREKEIEKFQKEVYESLLNDNRELLISW